MSYVLVKGLLQCSVGLDDYCQPFLYHCQRTLNIVSSTVVTHYADTPYLRGGEGSKGI